MAFLPGDRESYGAMGAITGGPTPPGLDGPIVIFACAVDLDEPLGRVEAAGGAVLEPKTPIRPYGFIAQFRDSEGNRIGLHRIADLTARCVPIRWGVQYTPAKGL